MNQKQPIRRTAILTLALASVLFVAGAGQATALDRAQDGDFGSGVVINLLERIGDLVSDLAVEVVDIFTKSTASPGSDG